MKSTIAIETLGCKVNQYESSYLVELLKRDGYEVTPFSRRADFYIVHSCAVTSKASYQTRQLLRRAHRLNCEAGVAVLGCDAQAEGDLIARDGIATHILGSLEKYDLVDWLKFPGTFSRPCHVVGNPRDCTKCMALPINKMHSGRSRAFLKVQDGCDAFCAYCIVPFTRGKSRSLEPTAVVSQMSQFLKLGYKEVVLTGIHLGQWGKDLNPPQNLANLLELIGKEACPPRLRLSSLEPMEWSQELIAKIKKSPWICHHFHVPLQSGDEEILGAMHRPYTPDHYRQLIGTLNTDFPDAALGADVMVGFPGETTQNFLNTLNLIKDLPLTYLHVFPFSPRTGTVASRLPNRVTGEELKKRSKALQNISMLKKLSYSQRFIGRSMAVLPEQEIEPGWWQGTSPNYLKINFATSDHLLPGIPVYVKLTHLEDQILWGTMCNVVH